MNLDEVSAHVLSAESLRMSRRLSREGLRVAVAQKSIIVVHRGWYVDADTWSRWFAEERHAARAIAAARAARGGDVVLSHTSAAVLWNLPLFRYEPSRVHVSGATAHGLTKGPGLARHATRVEDDWETIGGLRVTSLARTVADVVGILPLEAAVALADAASRLVAWDSANRTYADGAADRFRTDVLARPALQPGARGVVQARWVVGFADGRAESPLESVSRLYLLLLGFAAPRLQVRVSHSRGFYELDFALDDADVWAEVDGTVKYTDAAVLADRTAADIVLAEKRREDDIRGRTGRRVIRWGSRELRDLERFRAVLASFGVRPSRQPVQPPPTFRDVRRGAAVPRPHIAA
ncbi:hypothetical protein [Microbacterium sp. BK668]|uniref:hypothetical protein n=1 Tax=Microbacterium sp. BK668 TaxID=2512118 RepID=UPI00105F2C54|nr:hypothetical protein [Microbacterium sp. BK668]